MTDGDAYFFTTTHKMSICLYFLSSIHFFHTVTFYRLIKPPPYILILPAPLTSFFYIVGLFLAGTLMSFPGWWLVTGMKFFREINKRFATLLAIGVVVFTTRNITLSVDVRGHCLSILGLTLLPVHPVTRFLRNIKNAFKSPLGFSRPFLLQISAP